MGGYVSAGATGSTGSWSANAEKLDRLAWLFENQKALEHFYKRAGEMLVGLVLDEPDIEQAIEKFLLDKQDFLELNLISENIDAIRLIREELSKRHKGLTN